MEEITFTTKAVSTVVAADAAIVKVEKESFGRIVKKYCDLGTAMAALPGHGTKGHQARVMAAAEAAGHPMSQSRASRASTVAEHGTEGYEAYIASCDEEEVTPSLTGLFAFYKGDEEAEVVVLKGKALVDDKVKKVEKVLAGLTTRQRAAVLAMLTAE